MTDTRVATFWVEDLHLAVDILRVQEVLHEQHVAFVPLAHPAVRGLLNLRGQIATTVDARRRLGLAERAENADAVHMITTSRGELMSLVVDREGDVIDLDTEAMEVPQTVDLQIRSLVTGVHKLTGSLLLMIDVDRMLTTAAD
jgi:purine-binding chemotaxis protein CheW